jgi:DNA-binding FadR family transcriptional regulator
MIKIDLRGLGPRPETGASVALIAERLSTAIHAGLIEDGSRITQQALANHFGVSRMPAREALRQVQAQGLIEYRHNRSPLIVRPKLGAAAPGQERLRQLEAQLRQAKEVFDFMYRDPVAAAGCWRELAMQQAEDIDAVLAASH